MEPIFIIEEQFTLPLHGPIQERRKLLWLCSKDEIEVPILVQSGRVWRSSTCPLCGQRISRRQAQRELNFVFAYEAWERDQQAVATYLVVTKPSTQPFNIREEHFTMTTNGHHMNETHAPTPPVDVEICDARIGNDANAAPSSDTPQAAPEEPKGRNLTQQACSAAKLVLKTVKSVAFGVGVITGAVMLWGAAEIAKRVVKDNTEETPTQA